MNLTPHKMKAVVFLGAASLLATSLVAAAIVPSKRLDRAPAQESRSPTNTLPQIIRKVKDLEIVTASIKDQGKPNASAVFKIENNSDKAVTAFTLTFGSASVSQEGGMDADEPEAVIKPHGTTTLEIPLSNFMKDEPLIIAAVLYADGTEDGQEAVLEWRHEQRARAKAERDAKRKVEPQK